MGSAWDLDLEAHYDLCPVPMLGCSAHGTGMLQAMPCATALQQIRLTFPLPCRSSATPWRAWPSPWRR